MEKKENEMDIFNQLIKYEPGLLEKPIEELVPISFIGGAAIQAYRSIVSKLPNLPMTQEQKEKTLRDGQDAGKMLLAIETRIGELLPSVTSGKPSYEKGYSGAKKSLPKGISGKESHIAQTIARHPTEVTEVIKEAEEAEDIPTKTAVVNKVRFKKEQERRKEAEKKVKPEIIISLEEQAYLLQLERTISVCPKESEMPKNWHEEAFKTCCTMRQIIYKRLRMEDLQNETKNISG